MRISVGRLRILIEKSLTQAPLEDVLPPIEEPDRYGYRQKGYGSSEKDAETDKKQVQKFYKSPAYRDKAVKAFKNLTIPIYVIPSWTSSDSDEYRLSTYDHADVKGTTDFLSEHCKLSPEKVKELMGALGSGATIFVSSATALTKSFLPTPWMLIHALYDNSGRSGNPLSETPDNLYELCDELFNQLLPSEIVGYDKMSNDSWSARDKERNEKLAKIFTFGSARARDINSEGDLAAEICVQEILTTQGFVYNETGDPDIDEKLSEMADMVKGERQRFEAAVRGKVLRVNVYAD